MPDSGNGNSRRLADTVARSNGYAALVWVSNSAKQLNLPLVRLNADHLAGEGNGVAVVSRHQFQKRVICRIFLRGHVNTYCWDQGGGEA